MALSRVTVWSPGQVLTAQALNGEFDNILASSSLAGSITFPLTAVTGDLWYASATNVMSALADVAAGSYLRSGGVTTAPVWSTVTFPNTATTGDLHYASATNVVSNLADVAAGSYLRSGGVTTAPLWSTLILPNAAATGSLLHASSTDTITALADVASGSYLRSGGVGVVPVWSTATIPNTTVVGDLWYSSATNVMSALADVAVGSYLRSGGVATAPLWSTLILPNAATRGDLLRATAANTIGSLTMVTKGTIAVGDGTDVSTVAVGTNTQVLTADSTQVTGIKWAAGGGGTGLAIAFFSTDSNLGTTASTTVFLSVTGSGIPAGTDTIAVGTRKIITRAATAKNLYIELTTAPGANGRTVTVYKNGVSTALTTGVFTGATASDTVNTVSFAAGDTMSLAIINGVGAPLQSDGIVVGVELV